MRNSIIVKDANAKIVLNMKGYLEMRLGWNWLSRLFKKIDYKLVDDALTCVVFQVKTRKETFEQLKKELDELFPGKCVYLVKKEETQP